ncbi:hypothetical protein RHGRI_014223 [Rhododendron griersonianum]|uniref:Uncharacterized protein n=1 Tax=Rhododendron griersonianum TaxID=479676 RepID=A0AAV6K8J1_9ERIC|nr:hypothetical protein RHGRI_014223 [Rhododendron griersonianum]
MASLFGFCKLPIGYRLWRHIREEAAKGHGILMNPFKKRPISSCHGVPLGGMGLPCLPNWNHLGMEHFVHMSTD